MTCFTIETRDKMTGHFLEKIYPSPHDKAKQNRLVFQQFFMTNPNFPEGYFDDILQTPVPVGRSVFYGDTTQ